MKAYLIQVENNLLSNVVQKFPPPKKKEQKNNIGQIQNLQNCLWRKFQKPDLICQCRRQGRGKVEQHFGFSTLKLSSLLQKLANCLL